MALRGGQVVSKLRVLIVDDEDDMRALLREMITIANDGLSVAGEAVDGDEALRRWREDRPDVVLLDQRMPGLSGLETAERMLSESPNQAVVLFTAYLDSDIQQAAENVGVRACVSKNEARKVIARLRECAAA
jgi:DNA-binding NarL/FixJ family response regulator